MGLGFPLGTVPTERRGRYTRSVWFVNGKKNAPSHPEGWKDAFCRHAMADATWRMLRRARLDGRLWRFSHRETVTQWVPITLAKTFCVTPMALRILRMFVFF